MRSAAGLLALQTLPAVGELTALRHALLATEFDPYLGEHARLWAQSITAAQEEIERCHEEGIAVVSIFDDAYPARLRTIENPPPVLYLQGDVEALEREPAIALGGSPEPAPGAIAATEQIVAALAPEHWIVIAGLGEGIETVAHRSALAHDAITVAVLPGGFDHIPAPSRELAQAILAAGGALISRYRMIYEPSRTNAIDRSRIETALALALILTEASVEDLAMYTARHAAAQRRPVFCAQSQLGARDEGLRILLNTPANRLHELLLAWKGRGFLAGQLGEKPYAKAISPGDPKKLLATLEDVIVAERADPPQPKWWPEPRSEGERTSSTRR